MAGIMERFVTCNLGPAPASSATASAASTPIPTDKDLCAAAMHMLKVQSDRDMIPRYLEKLDTTEGDSAIANKTGAIDHARVDVGAVYTKHGAILISAFTHDNADTSWTPTTKRSFSSPNWQRPSSTLGLRRRSPFVLGIGRRGSAHRCAGGSRSSHAKSPKFCAHGIGNRRNEWAVISNSSRHSDAPHRVPGSYLVAARRFHFRVAPDGSM